MQPECSKCGRPAIYLRRYTSEQLCGACLVQTTVDRVRRTINRQKMFLESDRILVAVSGGKDSTALLHMLHNIESAFPKSEIVPVTIDEGVRGYRDKSLESARELSHSLDLTLEVFSFRELFGYSLDEIVQRKPSSSLGACSYCGVLRRRALNTAAQELGASVVATGHNLDDEAQTVLMNLMRGDSPRIARINVSREQPTQGFVPRVKPLAELTERDIVTYSHYLSLPYHDIPCPYADDAYRNDVRAFLNDMEYRRPGTLLAILRSSEAIVSAFRDLRQDWQLMSCEKCGNPSSTRVCKACEMLETIR